MKKVHGNKAFKPNELKDLMGISDVGHFLGWHRAKVNTYRRRAENGELREVDFPEPYLYVGNRAQWTIEQMSEWASRNIERLGEGALYLGGGQLNE